MNGVLFENAYSPTEMSFSVLGISNSQYFHCMSFSVLGISNSQYFHCSPTLKRKDSNLNIYYIVFDCYFKLNIVLVQETLIYNIYSV